MIISILEKIDFTVDQLARLKKLGKVQTFNYLDGDYIDHEKIHEVAINSNVIVVNWIDPTPFLMEMKSDSLVALLSTGYGWITNIAEAKAKGISVAYIPGCSTEAVAEHLLGLLLGVTKHIFDQLNVEKQNGKVGCEIAGKTVGIIGLGKIGTRFAEILQFFGAKVITYNRTNKQRNGITDVTLKFLLHTSDIICMTPALNNESKNLINSTNYHLVKDDAIIIGSTLYAISFDTIVSLIAEKSVTVAFDAALEGELDRNTVTRETIRELLLKRERLFFTPHVAYFTNESEFRRLNTCVSNIEAFIFGNPQNIV